LERTWVQNNDVLGANLRDLTSFEFNLQLMAYASHSSRSILVEHEAILWHHSQQYTLAEPARQKLLSNTSSYRCHPFSLPFLRV
jgi:hypothetical protein